MDLNIEVICLHFQGNESAADKLWKYFSIFIQDQQSHHNLNCKKHTLQSHASKEVEVLEIVYNHTTIHSIWQCMSLLVDQVVYLHFLNLKLPCFSNINLNIMRGNNVLIFLHHGIYVFRVPMFWLYHIRFQCH